MRRAGQGSTDCEVRSARPGDEQAVVELSGLDDHSLLRPYERLGFATERLLPSARLDAVRAGVIAESGGECVGFLGVADNEFDSDHFGLGMVQATTLVTRPGWDRGHVVARLVAAVREQLAPGVVVVMATLDGDDVDGLAAFLAAGARYCETGTLYLGDSLRPPTAWEDGPGDEVEVLLPGEMGARDPGDYDLVRRAIRKVPWYGHLHVDPRLPDEVCDRRYEEWFDRSVRGEWADTLIVARREGQVVGLSGWRRWPEFEAVHGVGVLNRAFGLVDPDQGRRSLRSILVRVCRDPPLGARFVEAATQLRNLPVNVLSTAAPLSMRLVRSTHVVHLWLDE